MSADPPVQSRERRAACVQTKVGAGKRALRYRPGMRWLFSLVTVLGCAAACLPSAPRLDGGSPADDNDDNDDNEGERNDDEDTLPATTYCEELAPVFCPFYVRCGRMNVDDVDACRAAFPASCETRYEPRFAPLAAAGLVSLSRAGLDACAAHLDEVPCDEQFFELSGPCAAIWRGLVPVGGACGLDVETFVCAPGTTCSLDLSFCGTCERTLATGTPCGGNDDQGTCGNDGVCVDGACARRPRSGEACEEDGVPCVLPARCDDDGICREPAVVDVGDPCDFSRRCPYFAACDEGVCVALQGPSGPCQDDSACEASFCDEGVCQPLGLEGIPCTRDAQCGSGRCDDGTCTGFPALCVENER